MVHRREILTSALVLATGGLTGADLAAAAPQADAPTLLRNAAQAYAALNSYQDNGTVTRYDGSDSPYQVVFTTSYKSPSLFRFGFSRPHPYPPLRDIVTKFEVGFDGTAPFYVTTEYQKAPRSVPTQNVDQALARATGISSGAAHTISRLLLRDISGLSILDLVEARSLDDATVNGIECYLISAQHPRGGEWRFWIEKDTLLIRKLRTHLGAREESFSEEVHENIRVNQPIDDGQFKVAV
jgi:hypothetical protein